MSSDFENPNFSSKIGKALDIIQVSTGNGEEQVVKMQIYDNNTTEEVFVTNLIPENQAFAIVAKKNHKYIVTVDNYTNQVYISDYFREPTLIIIVGIFICISLLIGKVKGLKSLLSLGIITLLILGIFIPAIKNHWDPVSMAIVIASLAGSASIILTTGYSKKSLAAIIGTMSGLSFAGILGYLCVKLAPLSGLASQEAQILLANQNYSYDFQGILAAGILISSLGAIIDVAISIASASQEIYLTDPKQSFDAIFKHAMNIGKDIMGAMINTLILAYVGSSLPLFLILYNQPGPRICNLEIIATEIISALAGCIGLTLAIPITACISAYLMSNRDIFARLK